MKNKQHTTVFYTFSKTCVRVYTVLLLSAFILVGCKENTKVASDYKPYDGPIGIFNTVQTIFSDSALLKVSMAAPLQEEYLNGNRIFPKGIYLVFFGKDKDTSATLIADKGKYEKKTGVYTATGNVIITNRAEGKTMKTEELHWNPMSKKIYTEAFVRIETPTEILTGNGLDAHQDFTHYVIRNPSGVFAVQQP